MVLFLLENKLINMYVRTTSSALTTPNQLLSVDVPHCAQSEWMSERVDVPLLD